VHESLLHYSLPVPNVNVSTPCSTQENTRRENTGTGENLKIWAQSRIRWNTGIGENLKIWAKIWKFVGWVGSCWLSREKRGKCIYGDSVFSRGLNYFTRKPYCFIFCPFYILSEIGFFPIAWNYLTNR
jgi:hypothetical protein